MRFKKNKPQRLTFWVPDASEANSLIENNRSHKFHSISPN